MRLELKGLDNVKRKVKNLSNAKLKMNIISNMGRNDVVEHFNKSEGPREAWESLTKRSGKPLQDTGRLFGSIKARHTKNNAEVFTNIGYAKFHEYGTKHIPKRQFMFLSKDAKDKIINTLKRDYTNEYK